MLSALLVCGARELLYHPGAHAYVSERVRLLLAEVPCANILLHGGAVGPDQWAATVARNRGVRVVTYRPDGQRLDTHTRARRWAAGNPGPLARNRAMVDGLARVDGSVRVVGFLTPWEAATHCTQATIAYARQRGIEAAVDEVPARVGWLEKVMAPS